LAKILAIKKKLISNAFLCKLYPKHPLQALSLTSFFCNKAFFVDLAPLQLVYFAIVNGEMAATITR
jgi:hypothetical protein